MTERNKRASRVGIVVSETMDKTAVVRVQRLVKHPVFKKYVRRSKKYYAHDEANGCHVGDKVLIEATRPMSRLKRWRIKEILAQATGGAAAGTGSEEVTP